MNTLAGRSSYASTFGRHVVVDSAGGRSPLLLVIAGSGRVQYILFSALARVTYRVAHTRSLRSRISVRSGFVVHIGHSRRRTRNLAHELFRSFTPSAWSDRWTVAPVVVPAR